MHRVVLQEALGYNIICSQQLFRRSSMVEQEAVNFEVTGSSPVAGAMIETPAYL